ncbi:MAG: IS66 family insertion sequence element accessory protein TnpB [Opitutales bacterium]|jgi:transposase
MLPIPSNIRIFLACEPVDMRKQFNGLWTVAQNQLGEDPFGGALFAFTNRDHNRIKLLYWDGTGVWVFAKRLEKGRFTWPRATTGNNKVHLAPEALTMLLCGIDLKDGCRKAWYEG